MISASLIQNAILLMASKELLTPAFDADGLMAPELLIPIESASDTASIFAPRNRKVQLSLS